MSIERNKYILDANVFIEAHRRYYSFDLAPSFWKFLIENAKANRLLSIDRVYSELTRGNDILAEWVKKEFSFAFISTIDDSKILENYAKLMNWANRQTQYSQNAKDEFARSENADAWIIATAMAKSFIVVTQEVLDTNIKKNIPIPNVCRDFEIDYINTFELMRKLNFTFG